MLFEPPVMPASLPPAPPTITTTSTVGDLVVAWLDDAEHVRRLKAATVRKCRSNARHVLAGPAEVAGIAGIKLGELTRRRIIEWHRQLARARTGALADRAVALIRSALAFAIENEVLSENRASRLKCLKHKPAAKVPLSYEQWRDLALVLHEIEAERGARARRVHSEAWQRFGALSATRACIALLICAARSCEVIKGTCALWRPERSQLLVPNGKTGPQLITFGDEVGGPWMTRQVAEASAFGLYIFPSPVIRDTHVGYASVWETLHVACGRARISGVALHHLRTTAATTALELGVPLADVQALLCHEDIKTTEIYTQLAQSPAQRLAARELEQCRIRSAPDIAALLRLSASTGGASWL